MDHASQNKWYAYPSNWVWAVAALICAVIAAIVAYNENSRYYDAEHSPINKIPTEGRFSYVIDVRMGWCNNEGALIEHNYLSRDPVITVFMENFDGWLLKEARGQPQLLPNGLTAEQFASFEKLRAKKGTPLTEPETAELASLQAKVSQWIVAERSNLRLMVAGNLFSSLAPFDASAPPSFYKGFEGDTFHRMVFRFGSPSDPVEKEKWREIVRAVGADCRAQITLARPVPGAPAIWMRTLVNTDSKPDVGDTVIRELPLVPAIRRGAAGISVILTVAMVLGAALGTSALKDGRDSTFAATGGRAPWSLSRVVFAWWVTICGSSFAFIWAMTGDHKDTLSKTVPLLLGIQGATLLVTAGFGRRAPSAKTSSGELPAAATEVPPTPSQGFFLDLLAEGGEPEVSRLEMLVWNAVLGIVFAWQTLFEWQMPDFDATIMTLLGISSTAYAGFKFLPGSGAPRPPQDTKTPGS